MVPQKNEEKDGKNSRKVTKEIDADIDSGTAELNGDSDSDSEDFAESERFFVLNRFNLIDIFFCITLYCYANSTILSRNVESLKKVSGLNA